MAVYLKSGEGRCPSPSSYTKTIYFSKTKLDRIRTIYGQHANLTEELVSDLIDVVIGAMEAPLLEIVLSIPKFSDLTTGRVSTYITDYLTGNVRNIAADVNDTTGGATFTCKIGCVNKGQNGHYWVIKSFCI